MSLTVQPSIPEWVFSRQTINIVRQMCAHNLRFDVKRASILINDNSILRCLFRVYNERQEQRYLMIRRVVMMICNEFRTTELEKERNRHWEESFPQQSPLYDQLGRKGPDLLLHKLSRQPTGLAFHRTIGTW